MINYGKEIGWWSAFNTNKDHPVMDSLLQHIHKFVGKG